MRVPSGSALESTSPGFVFRELQGLGPRSWKDNFRLHPGAVWESAFGRFDVYVLSGLYTSVTFLICAFLLALRRKPWAVWLERPRPPQYRNAGGRITQSLRHTLLRLLLRRASKVIGIGSEAVRNYRALGAPETNLLMLPYCCDTTRFRDVDREKVEQVRRRYQLHGKIVYLFSGQMIERKGVDVLLAAFERLADKNADAVLLLLGSGPLLETYQRAVRDELRSRVHFTGFVTQADLPAYFSAADVFVFPSRHDGWAVVVNEACAAGLPVIVSLQTGAAFDLVRNAESGFVLDCKDVDGFCARMRHFLDRPQDIGRFGELSRKLVQPFSAESGAWTFLQHVKQTIETRVKARC